LYIFSHTITQKLHMFY